jgi:RNA polymerase sigma-70 factor (ECF subfamily)
LDEARVIAKVKAGTLDAFGEIVEHYQAPIVRYLYRLTGDSEVARDLAQDAFLQAYRGILKTRSDLSLKAWLYKIATNNARQYHRRRRVLSFVPFFDTEKPGVPEPRAAPDHTDERLAIEETLLQVSEEKRACLVLHFVEGLRYREIGEILGITEEAVRKRVARGSEDFRRAYRRQEDESNE